MEKVIFSQEERKAFWRRVKISKDCWSWKGEITPDGYGRFVHKQRRELSHRYVYILLNGKIPDGLHIDHLCRNRGCCNPFHLEMVTRKENILRGISPAANNARKTHCPKGHSYDEENTINRTDGHRQCRICTNRTTSLYRERKKQETLL